MSDQRSTEELFRLVLGRTQYIPNRHIRDKTLADLAELEARVEELEAALREIINLFHGEPETYRGIARAALSAEGERKPHQGDYEPPEIDDWRPGDERVEQAAPKQDGEESE